MTTTGSVEAGSGGAGDHRSALLAGYLGWTLDAFDFFLVVMCLTAIGREFHKSDKEMALATVVTLAAAVSSFFTFMYFRSRARRRFPLQFDPIVVNGGTDEIL